MTNPPTALSPINEVTLNRLLTILDFAKGHTLLFAHCNAPALREQVIATARARLTARGTTVYTLTLTTPTAHLVEQVNAILPPPSVVSAQEAVLFLIGLEYSIPVEEPHAPMLAELNLGRDPLQRSAPLPIVFWLPDDAITALSRHALDFWSRRSDLFEFEAEEVHHRHNLETIQPDREWPATSNLSLEEKRRRLNTFEAMLSDYADEGTPRWMRMRLLLLRQLGQMNELLNNFADAQPRYDEALALARQVEDGVLEAELLARLGRVFEQQGEPEQALDYYEQALALHLERNDAAGEAGALSNLALLFARLDRTDQALDYYARALQLQRDRNDLPGEAAVLNNMGLVHESLEQRVEALRYFEEALPLYRAAGDVGGEATTLNNMGGVYSSLGQKEAALHYFQLALPLRRAVGDRSGEATTLNNMGIVFDSLGQKSEALGYYRQALPLRREVGDQDGEATTLNNMAIVLEDLGQESEALQHFEQALPLYQAVGNRAGEASILNNMGGLYFSLGEQDQALRYFERTLFLRRAVGDRGGEAATLNNLGLVYMEMDDEDQSLQCYMDAADMFAEIGDLWSEQLVRSNIGLLHAEAERWHAAARQMQRAVAIARAVNHPDLEENEDLLDHVLENLLLAHFRAAGHRDPAASLESLSLDERQALVRELLAEREE